MMTKKKLFLSIAHFIVSIISILSPYSLYAQNDSIRKYDIQETVIEGIKEKGTLKNKQYSPGTYNQHFNIASTGTSTSSSLADFIREQTALYIKEYGRGGSAYLSLRGTSSSHTSVIWNGQDMSLPTMGQTDFSHIPLYFYDNIDIHFGGSSSLFGNGSLGGALSLETTPKWKRGISGDVSLSTGSFASLFGGGTLRYCSSKLETRSSVFYSGAKNNYFFKNNTIEGFPSQRVNNAAYRNMGALQELFLKFKDESVLSLNLCYLDFNRQIQPSVSNNDRPENYSSIYDNNFKGFISYAGSRGSKWFYNAQLSYCYDYELFEQDIIAANRYLSTIEGEYRGKKFSIKVGNSLKYTLPKVYAYSAGTFEWNEQLFALFKWRATPRTTIAGGIRYSVVTDIKVPLMPSINAEILLLESQKHNLSFRSSASISSKIPTLNDRYWGGTYTKLLPEESYNFEGGFDYSANISGWYLKSFITGYYAMVKNWIRWLPVGTIWRPQNIAGVQSTGGEAGVKIEKNISKWKLSFNALYSLTFVSMTESTRANDPALGHQLAYQPYNTFASHLGAKSKKWAIQLSAQVTGERTTTDIFDILPPYCLLDLVVNHTFTFGEKLLKVGGEVKNILNTNYQNVKFYPMPGINFLININFKF